MAWLSILICATGILMVLISVPGWSDLPVITGLLLCAWTVQLILIRPRVFLSEEWLTLRGSFSDLRVPVEAVNSVLIGHYTRIVTEQRTYSTSAISRRLRPSRELTSADAFEADLRGLIERHSVRREPADQVTRSWAWRDLLVLLALVLLFALSFLFKGLFG